MPTFDAGASIETLDYDFSKVPGYPRKLKSKGTVKEPSDAAIGRFLEGLKNMVKDATVQGIAGLTEISEDAPPEAILDALDGVTGDAFVSMMAMVSRLYADLCGDSPDFEQLQALPLRVRTGFFAWIMDQVVRPEVGAPAGNGQVLKLPIGATG
jgi:hypothetical protein